MPRQEEPDNEKIERELDDQLQDDDELDELDEEEETTIPQRGAVDRGEKSREGDAGEVDDRVAWRDDDEEPADDDVR